MHLIAQPPLGPDAHAIADDEHPDHQLRIDRRAARLAVERLQLLANAGQVDEPVDRAQQMVRQHVPLQAEAVEQRLCATVRSPLIGPSSLTSRRLNQTIDTTARRPFFNTIGRERPPYPSVTKTQ